MTVNDPDDFLRQVVTLSGRNPGAIVAMIRMASHPQYRFENQIKTTLLLLDYRMGMVHS